jgi:hypothetical protein
MATADVGCVGEGLRDAPPEGVADLILEDTLVDKLVVRELELRLLKKEGLLLSPRVQACLGVALGEGLLKELLLLLLGGGLGWGRCPLVPWGRLWGWGRWGRSTLCPLAPSCRWGHVEVCPHARTYVRSCYQGR